MLTGLIKLYRDGSVVEYQNAAVRIDSEGISQIGAMFSAMFEVLDKDGVVVHRFPMSVSLYGNEDPTNELYASAKYHMCPAMS